MFRAAQANPFDDAVVKATDENLTSENWEYIFEVVDKVQGSDSGGKDAVASMIKRLAHRNANVQLYTLELANALSQNCGLKIHKELASRSFTDALLRLANDRNTHTQVKAKIIETMAEWTEMFSSDPDLGIMDNAYQRLKSQNPSIQAPSKPFKREITDADRQKEQDELQLALALSVKEKPAQPTRKASQGSPTTAAQAPSQSQPAGPQAIASGTTAATVSRVRALYDFQPSEAGELQFRKGDVIAVLESVYKDWWRGSLRGQSGIFPLNYVEKLQDPTQDELMREAQMEAEVFAEIKNVEKLLTLLSTSSSDMNVRENDEITTLYHQTLAIRPKLIELIAKYSQKKDEFTQLNEKFIKARRDYEFLLDSSMSHQAQQPYTRPPQSGYGYGGGPPPQGYPPPQQEPQRYYTPQPQQQPQPQEQSYPPRNGPAPFFMVPPGQQQPAQQPPSHADTRPPKPVSPDPYGAPPAPANRTSSYGHPQELATTNFDPTYDSRYHGQQPPQPHYPPGQPQDYQQPQYDTPYPPHNDHYQEQQQQQHQPQYYPQQPPHGAPQPPGSPPQAHSQPGYPTLTNAADTGPPPSLQPHAPPASLQPNVPPASLQPHIPQQPQYQAYPPGGRYPSGGGGVSAGGGAREADVSDFYRT